MKRKNFIYFLSVAALSGMFLLSGCGKPKQVSQDTVVSQNEFEEDNTTTVPDDTAVQDDTAVSDNTTVQGEPSVPDETNIQDQTTGSDGQGISDGSDTAQEGEEKVHGLLQQIEWMRIVNDEETGEPRTYYYDKDLDLIKRVLVDKSGQVISELQYEYLTDEAGNKVKGFNLLAYLKNEPGFDSGISHLDHFKGITVHTNESLLKSWNVDGSWGQSYSYDHENRLVSAAEGSYDEGYHDIYDVVYGDDTAEIIPSSGNDRFCRETVSFSEDGQILSIVDEALIYNYQYDEYGNQVFKSRSSSNNYYETEYEYEYDEEGRPWSIKEISDGDIRASVIISYDANGQVAEETVFENLNETDEWVRSYTYGENGKLVSTAVNDVTEWELVYEGEQLVQATYNDLSKHLDVHSIIRVNDLDFVSQYIKDEIGVQLPYGYGYRDGCQYKFVYEGA